MEPPRLPACMRSWFWSSLPYIPLFAGLVFIGLGIFVIIWASHQAETTTSIHAVSQNHASEQSALAAKTVALSLERFDHTLLAIITRYQSLEGRDVDEQAGNAAYFEGLQLDRHVAFVGLTDKSGKQIAGRPKSSNDYSDRDYFSALEHDNSDRPFIGGRFSPDNDEAVGFTISRRMVDTNGNFAGVVVIGIRLAYFREMLGPLVLNSGQSLMIVRNDGVILLRLPFRLKDVGDRLERGTPLYAALGPDEGIVTAPDPIDHAMRRFDFHRIGSFPLWLGIGTEVASPTPAPLVWWLVAGICVVVGVAILWWRRQR